MIDLRTDAGNGAIHAGEAGDEVIDLPPPPSESPDATTSRDPIRLPDRPRRLGEMPDQRGPGQDQAGGDEEKKLVVGEEIVFNGKISSLDLLVVEGKVDANLKDCRAIEIAESGSFKGKVEFERADIAGMFEGELTVREHLVVRSTGRVIGKVRFGELEIERGGQIVGDILVFDEAGPVGEGRAGTAARKPARAKKAGAKKAGAKNAGAQKAGAKKAGAQKEG